MAVGAIMFRCGLDPPGTKPTGILETDGRFQGG
jgi:hypothetical protein